MEKIRAIMMLIKALGANYPVMAAWRMSLSKLLLLIVEPGQGMSALNILSDKHTAVIDEFMSPAQLRKVWTDVSSNFVIFHYRPSKKANTLLEDMASIAASGTYAGHTTMGLPLVISEGLPLGFSRELAFTIFLEENLLMMERISLTDVVPPDEQLCVVDDRIGACIKANVIQTRDDLAMFGAVCFLYPNFPTKEKERAFISFRMLARSLIETNDNSQTSESLGELAIKELFCWREETGFSEVYELPDVDMETAQKLSRVVLFDNEYIWMSETLFKKAMAALRRIFPITVIMDSLVESDVILKEATKTYTVKMGYRGHDGNYQRRRMLRLSREKLTPLGEMGFVEQCLNAK